MWITLSLIAVVAVLICLFLTAYLPGQRATAEPAPPDANQMEKLLHRLVELNNRAGPTMVAAEWGNNALWFGEVVVGAMLASNLVTNLRPSPYVLAGLGVAVLFSGLVRKNFRPEEKLQLARARATDLYRLHASLQLQYDLLMAKEPWDEECERKLAELAEQGTASLVRIEEQTVVFDPEPVRFRTRELVAERKTREAARANKVAVGVIPIVNPGGGGVQ